MCNKGGCMQTSQNNQDKELIHKRCNCYTTQYTWFFELQSLANSDLKCLSLGIVS